MTACEDLKSIRSRYPATTSAVYTLMLRASELHRSRQRSHWVDLNGRNLSEVGFERSMSQVFDCAQKETGKSDPRDLLGFVNGFLAQFASVSYGCEAAFEEIRNRRLSEDEITQILANTPAYDVSRYAPAV